MISNIVNFLVSPAYADAGVATPPPGGGGMSLFVMFGIFILFMYLAIWRPQSKRAKEHRNLIDSIAKGDEVITAGGLLGKVTKISDQYIVVSFDDKVEVAVQKSSIVGALPKGTIKAI